MASIRDKELEETRRFYETRATLAYWVLYTAIIVMGLAFIIGFAWRAG